MKRHATLVIGFGFLPGAINACRPRASGNVQFLYPDRCQRWGTKDFPRTTGLGCRVRSGITKISACSIMHLRKHRHQFRHPGGRWAARFVYSTFIFAPQKILRKSRWPNVVKRYHSRSFLRPGAHVLEVPAAGRSRGYACRFARGLSIRPRKRPAANRS